MTLRILTAATALAFVGCGNKTSETVPPSDNQGSVIAETLGACATLPSMRKALGQPLGESEPFVFKRNGHEDHCIWADGEPQRIILDPAA